MLPVIGDLSKLNRFAALLTVSSYPLYADHARRMLYDTMILQIISNKMRPKIGDLFQLARLGLCEKLLVAIELSGRINDTQLGTQAIIQTYGLLAPLIHHNIMCYPALKVS